MSRSKKITIEDLAGMVKRGFDDVDHRLDAMDTRFDHIDNRLNGIDHRLDAMDTRLDRIENLLLKKHDQEIEQLKVRVKELEDLFAMPTKK